MTALAPYLASFLREHLPKKCGALSAMAPTMLKPRRFRAPDKLLAMLNSAGRKSNYAE